MKSFRTTKQNKIILNFVEAHHDHPTADQIYLEARTADSHISRGTVYRNLDKLCETDNLLRIKVPGAADRFDGRLDYHYHMVCTNCEKVFDAPIEYQENIDKFLAEKSDFKIFRHRTVFEGLCPVCQQKVSSLEKE